MLHSPYTTNVKVLFAVKGLLTGSFLLDVTSLREGFVGDVQVGIMGRIQRVFSGDMITQ